ncbi:uncharacterized protein LOC142319939 [Lycorma delicatula]|uniref:uncharacterized protein LOC142319939 n=1 Tax=Lycorma delicatula TaxID=130591 RepID=UPI003F518619
MEMPNTLFELHELIKQKETAVEFLQCVGILPFRKTCSLGHEMTLCLSDSRDRWRCHRMGCREDVQLKKDTWLEQVKVDYSTILLFIYCWSYEMTSITFCKRELNISPPTVVDWNNILREACAAKLLRNPTEIGGPNMNVEIGESVFKKRKYNRGRQPFSQCVFGGVCRETNECFLFAVPDKTEATLLPIIVKNIRPGTIVHSDQWATYNGIRNKNCNYTHLTLNHSRNFIDPIAGSHTQHIEGLWSLAKRRNQCHFGTHQAMADSYMCEFMWRHCLGDRNPFLTILEDIAGYK